MIGKQCAIHSKCVCSSNKYVIQYSFEPLGNSKNTLPVTSFGRVVEDSMVSCKRIKRWITTNRFQNLLNRKDESFSKILFVVFSSLSPLALFRIVSGEKNLLPIVLVLQLAMKGDCTFTAEQDGTFYNLTSLIQNVADFNCADALGVYLYYVNFCRNTNYVCDTNTPVCQVLNANSQYNYALGNVTTMNVTDMQYGGLNFFSFFFLLLPPPSCVFLPVWGILQTKILLDLQLPTLMETYVPLITPDKLQ